MDGPLPPIQRWGRFLLLERLAAGGMAEIFLARHDQTEDFRKPIVIKRIHQHLTADPRFVNMFFDEARIAARLDHPGIVQIFELGRVGGYPFIAMEYIDGLSVRDVYRCARSAAKPMPWPLVAWLGARVCDALDHAHGLLDDTGNRAGLVHRDVSPHNLLLRFDGVPKLVDFGIARSSLRLEQTQSFSRKGKLRYMSPEQALGLPLDFRSDLFSLAVVLWELCSGRRLFDSEGELGVLKQIAESPIPEVSSPLGPIPAAFNTTLMRALEREPEDRIASAAELAAALDLCVRQAGEHSPARDAAAYLQELCGADLEARRSHVKDLMGQGVDAAAAAVSGPGAEAAATAAAATAAAPTTAPAPRRPRLDRRAVWGAAAALVALNVVIMGLALSFFPAAFGRGVAQAPSGAVVAAPSAAPAAAPATGAAADPAPTALAAEATPDARRDAAAPAATRPQRSPRPAAAAAGVRGYLTFNTVPWSEVYLGAKRLGQTTPLVNLALPAGTHRLRVLKEGRGPAVEVVVEIEAGRLTRKSLEL